MPLHVDIRLNRELLRRIHIGRLSGGTHADDINAYRAVINPLPTNGLPAADETVNWEQDPGATFTHRYGDGADVCVARAIHALRHDRTAAVILQGPDEHGSAYLTLTDLEQAPVHRTVTVTANLDLDENGHLLGLELLDTPAFTITGQS